MAEELEIVKSVENNKNLFEDVAKSYVNAKDIYKTQYDILDYNKIIDDMTDYITEYKAYSENENQKYEGKLLSITKNFFNSMFTDKKYRRKINLEQFRELNVEFLKKTKVLKSIIQTSLNDPNRSGEVDSIIRMTDNQYKKLMKVCRDDMKIYLWLSSSNSKHFAYHLDEATRKEYSNKKSPVMHKHIDK